jgi:hypothetical protein
MEIRHGDDQRGWGAGTREIPSESQVRVNDEHASSVLPSALLVRAIGNLVTKFPTPVARHGGRGPLERLRACGRDGGQLVQLDLLLPSLSGKLLRLPALLFSSARYARSRAPALCVADGTRPAAARLCACLRGLVVIIGNLSRVRTGIRVTVTTFIVFLLGRL